MMLSRTKKRRWESRKSLRKGEEGPFGVFLDGLCIR
jgi:hypothetical protein